MLKISRFTVVLLFSFFIFTPSFVWARDFLTPLKETLEKTVRTEVAPEDLTKNLLDKDDPSFFLEAGDVATKLYVATHWVDQGDVQNGLKLLRAIKDPGEFRPVHAYYTALALIYSGEIQLAASYLVELEQHYPKDPNYLYLKSAYMAQRQDLSGALDALDVALKYSKKNGKLYLQRGLLNLITFANDRAIFDLKKAIRYLPKTNVDQKQQAFLQLGLIYYNIKRDSEKASGYIEKGIELNPSSLMVNQFKKSLER